MANILIDPNFFLPPDVIDMRHSEEVMPGDDVPPTTSVDSTLTDGSIVPVEISADDMYTDPDIVADNSMYPPDTMVIISQTLRDSPGSGQVVDVIIEVDGEPGLIEYGVRLTKL